MKRSSLWSAVFVLFLVAGVGSRSWADEGANEKANETANDIPDKATCQTCSAHGAVHGEEEVVAWRLYDGAFYYFCSQQCGETFDGFPEAYVPRAVPRAAPQMVLTTVGGETVHIGKPAGEVQLLDFWATWCAPCIKAMPKLEKLQREFASQNFSVLGISIDEDTERFEKFLQDKKPGYRTVHDNGAEPAWARFFVVAIPAMVLIDGEGRIVGEWRGELDLEDIRQSIQAHLAVPPAQPQSH